MFHYLLPLSHCLFTDVNMIPRNRLGKTEQERDKVTKARRSAVMRGTGSGHDPRKIRHNGSASQRYRPPPQSDACWNLV